MAALLIPGSEAEKYMTDDDEMSDDDVSSEELDKFNAMHREAEQAKRDFQERGWVWQGEDPIKRVLVHPDDPEMQIWFDPYTGEQFLSRKLLEQLTQDAKREQESGPLSG
jgi:hypothetical protein